MQDSRFYPKAVPITAEAVAGLVGGKLVRGDGGTEANVVATPDAAGPGSICFAASAEAAAGIADAEGFICLAPPELAESIPGKCCLVATPDPKGALSLVLERMFPAGKAAPGVDPGAKVDPSAKLGKGVSVAAGAVVGAGAELGARVSIGPGAVIGDGCTLKDGVAVGANTVVEFAVIGEDTRIGPSTTIGNRGFGIARDGANFPARHLGRVVVGARCYIATQVNIDRGFIKDTVVGDAVMIDTMVHIAHNTVIGDGCVICGQVGIAGSVTIGRDNVFGSKAGVADNVTIGDGNVFAAMSGITKDVGDGQTMGGFPVVPIGEFRRQAVALRKLGRAEGKGDGNG